MLRLATGFVIGVGTTISVLRYHGHRFHIAETLIGVKTTSSSSSSMSTSSSSSSSSSSPSSPPSLWESLFQSNSSNNNNNGKKEPKSVTYTETKINDSRLREYFNSKGNREIKVFEEINKTTQEKFPKQAEMVTDLGQLYFFRWLIPTLNVKKALEVGVFTGSSSLAIAKGLPKDGKLVGIDLSEEYTSVAREFWKKEGVSDKIDLRIGKGIDVLKEMVSNKSELGTYDFVFIDAYKPEYKDYYELCLQLLKKNGVMCIDNTLWALRVIDESNQDNITKCIREFNEMVRKDDKRVEMALTSIGDGVTFIRKL